MHSRFFKGFLVPSILDCGYFEEFSSSVTEANVVADKMVCSDSQMYKKKKQMRSEDLFFFQWNK